MNEKKFNLLDEPWILVMDQDGKVQQKGLLDVLKNAHLYRRLAGELPTQDFAVLRLLLAVMQTVVYRYDADGNEAPVEDSKEALARWTRIWNAGKLPTAIIAHYLDAWRERFWLFHPDRPFYQVEEAAIGTEGGAAKLNGEISESNNKLRLFSSRSGTGKENLTFSEAARWLIYINGYDDTSAKPKGKNLPSVGAGWLGKMGIIYADGNNLFETIMLNLVLVHDQNRCWELPRPVWELETPRTAERVEIATPNNQAELLTLQSRRIKLMVDHDKVTGYTLLGGDFFQKNNAINEQMTVWRVTKDKSGTVEVQPKRNDPEKQMWRDFSNYAVADKDTIRPGVVSWVNLLKSNRAIERKKSICFKITAVQYGDKDFFVTDVFGDSIEFNTAILTQAGTGWSNLIREEISKCDEGARHLWQLKSDILKAAGVGQGNENQLQIMKEQYYYLLDVPFRKWLVSIDPEADPDPDEVRAQWREQAYRIALQLAQDELSRAGDAAFVGRKVDDRYYSAPDAFNRFQWKIRNCFGMDLIKEGYRD